MSYVSLGLVGQSGFIVISILRKCSIETYVMVDAVLSFIFSGIYEYIVHANNYVDMDFNLRYALMYIKR